MRFMLLQNYGAVESDCPPMTEWSPEDIKAHIEFQQALNAELAERGELVDAQGLAGPELARLVVSDGISAPAITDGPFPESNALPAEGRPDGPLGWILRVAPRGLPNQYRSDGARRRREELAASWSASPPDPSPARDDTLILMFLCCHPSLTPALAIPLTLRAVGGLTTREIATAFLVPEATMAQRISRAKAKIKASGEPFTLPPPDQRPERLRLVLHVLYLVFNEGYTSSSGPDLARTDLAREAVRLAPGLQAD